MRLLVLVVAFVAFTAHGQVRLKLTEGTVEPFHIALPQIVAQDHHHQNHANLVMDVIKNDLVRSGLFKTLAPEAYLQDARSLAHEGPRFADWRVTGAQGLLSARILSEGGHRMVLTFTLFDVIKGTQMVEGKHIFTPEYVRKVGHRVADDIYKRVTGEQGYFDSKILYVAEDGPATKRTKRIALMDQDGFGVQYLTDGRDLVLTPRMSPDMEKVTYLSYKSGKPELYLMNVKSRHVQPLGHFPRMTFAPRFSKDGSHLLLSYSSGEGSDVFRMDLATRQITQLTNSNGQSQRSINTSPCYSPDNSQIVYNSDMGGGPQLYVMNANGSNSRRISFNGTYTYGSPAWSPRGDWIAFTRIGGGSLSIGIMKPDGSSERILSSGYHNEGPTWAPNGRVLCFFRDNAEQGKRSTKLFSVDITGHMYQGVPTTTDASDPFWSPLND